MAITSIDIGDVRVWLCAYNPRDEKADLYCGFVVERARELLAGTTPDQVHAWLKAQHPQKRELIEYIEGGGSLPRNVEIGELAVTPGHEPFEAPVVAHLANQQGGKRNDHG